jgi:hypothetical protein
MEGSMQASSLSLTYTHATLSIQSTTIDTGSAPVAGRARVIQGNNSSASFDSGVTYTPASHRSFEDAAAAFYTAAFGSSGPNPFAANPTYSNPPFVPDSAANTASGNIIQAMHTSLGSLIDILA